MSADSMDRSSILYKRGMGNWQAWGDDISAITSAAESWRLALQSIEYPWLCWNIDEDWCYLQQKLVLEAGWTPVVGFDPRCGAPSKLVPGAIVVDFNRDLHLPVLYPHFPLEFAFLFCERIAFWHSDLLVRVEKMRAIAAQFKKLEQGETAAVSCVGWRNIFTPLRQRYWELIGCTTRQASKDQFDKGCGWWLHFHAHPNRKVNVGDRKLEQYYWDHGSGIMYWKRKHGGQVLSLKEKDYMEGHFSQIKFDQYKRISPNNEFRDLRQDLNNNFQLKECASKLGLADLLQ
jgi:hypothetical protein